MFEGDWIGWVGTYEDIIQGRPGQYVVRLKDNLVGYDCAYPGLELLPDGTLVATTYGHWMGGHEPYLLSVRFTMEALDGVVESQSSAAPDAGRKRPYSLYRKAFSG